MENSLIPSGIGGQLGKYFSGMDLPEDTNIETIHRRLTDEIIYMLMHEMEKLLGILYRIDVNEKKVKAVFGGPDPKQIAPALAQLIIDREMQKVASRYKHR